MFSIIM